MLIFHDTGRDTCLSLLARISLSAKVIGHGHALRIPVRDLARRVGGTEIEKSITRSHDIGVLRCPFVVATQLDYSWTFDHLSDALNQHYFA